MQQYRLLQKAPYPPRLVKVGFSYPALLFSWWWALFHGMWKLAVGGFFVGFVFPLVLTLGWALPVLFFSEKIPPFLPYLLGAGAGVLAASVPLVYGFTGNRRLVQHLIRQGYQESPEIWVGRNIHTATPAPNGEHLSAASTLWQKLLAAGLAVLIALSWIPTGEMLQAIHSVSLEGRAKLYSWKSEERTLRDPQKKAYWPNALKGLHLLAENGSPAAQARWGDVLLYGKYGKPKNLPRAVYWFRVAAMSNDGWAMRQLGILEAEGKIPGGGKGSRYWLARSDNVGTISARNAIVESPWYVLSLEAEHSKPALRKLTLAARMGHPYAQLRLAMLYDTSYLLGETTVSKNSKKSACWMRLAAEGGVADAQYNEGQLDMAQKRLVDAVRWWKKAAIQGDALAANNLAYSYQIGNGIDRNADWAEAWFRISCEEGYRQACKKAHNLLRSMPIQKRAAAIYDTLTVRAPLAG